ncbi:uncharacterized protein V6R79_001834 [Siganus canaliculatus]
MAAPVINHLSSEAHPSSQRHVDIHFAPVPLGWTVIGRCQGAEVPKHEGAFTAAEQRNAHAMESSMRSITLDKTWPEASGVGLVLSERTEECSSGEKHSKARVVDQFTAEISSGSCPDSLGIVKRVGAGFFTAGRQERKNQQQAAHVFIYPPVWTPAVSSDVEASPHVALRV